MVNSQLQSRYLISKKYQNKKNHIKVIKSAFNRKYLSLSKLYSSPPHVSPLREGDVLQQRLELQQRWKVFLLQMIL